MAEISVFPGVNRPDLVTEETSPEVALRSALDAGLVHVAIVGRQASGEIVVWGSQPDADQAIGLLMRGVTDLASAKQVQDSSGPEASGEGEPA